ncbi:MAG: sulfotransferase family protein [Moorea sp. SIO3I7]|uniref:sulfotransferase-like domain-containing protein n=1 Tax=unclassified Moorena TaxID=2683338 RepID=UPI0013C06CB5|nr:MULTISPECIES: sulfotransferase family protein [unclassified Moorena]NEN99603.1 sulfotransferase family protein [Moorena sp. SIO3I7]NEO04137.1 sulfotransferase family protein [Moorena sp. SIO3I8]NEO23993.1 sulfotransferase family protein [Moorena sp. SIO4A5]NEP26821.1 sulfotransferase family protein [Moorena sp. SIO3I6]NEQ61897.1 sulfotransferase family protein [Moorena sp. SIO4A1]
MKKILVLWTTFRSTSTAFKMMMQARGDFIVLHEPFSLYYYGSEERKSDRCAKAEINPAYNFQPLFQDLINKAQSQPVFIKDMALYIYDRADEAFLSHFNHTFLIRHPAKSLPSLFAGWPDFHLSETGYAELYQLFEVTKAFLGQVPPLIDSDDLVQKPEATIKAYCDAVGIPFMPQALKWNPKICSKIWTLPWEGDWHTYLQSSREFKERDRKNYVSVENNEHLKQTYDYCLPYYQRLYEHRLRIE